MTRAGRYLVTMGMLALACRAFAFVQGEADEEVALDAISRLASERWSERIAASADLMELARGMEPERAIRTLEAALGDWLAQHADDPRRDGDLAEVLARFELAAMDAFFSAPRAGLGITYDTTPTTRGVRLGGTVRGFDAYNKLREGDIVLAFSGSPVESGSMDLPVAIASFLPGETSVITLVRSGEEMRVEVELGTREDLRSARPLQDPVLRRAWAMRMDRLRGDGVQGRLDADGVRSVVTAPPSASAVRVRAIAADVSLGGEPGEMAARQAGVVAQGMPGNDPQRQIQAQLTELNAELARVVRRSIDIEETIRQIEVELRMTADTVEGRALRDELGKRLVQLRQELVPLQQEQTRLMQERVALIRALSQ